MQWRKLADQPRPKVPKLAALMDEAEPDVLAHMGFPAIASLKIACLGPSGRRTEGAHVMRLGSPSFLHPEARRVPASSATGGVPHLTAPLQREGHFFTVLQVLSERG